MSQFTVENTVGEIVASSPGLSRVFEELRIDYCCGGKRTLQDACAEGGLDASDVLERLLSQHAPALAEEDWQNRSLTELCDHIEATHHAYLKEELPRLTAIVAKVVNAHSANHPELHQVQQAFLALRSELEPHMMKEERILFPAIRHIEATGQAPSFPFGTVANPIRMMVFEHDNAGECLAKLRQLTSDYQVPEAVCNTYRVMLDALASLETDMHLHIHKENNILFPAAIAREAELAGRA